MKFCRNLQRVIDITDPEWAPYWTNYKMLKKFLKALVPPEDADETSKSDGGGGDTNDVGSPEDRSDSSANLGSLDQPSAGDGDSNARDERDDDEPKKASSSTAAVPQATQEVPLAPPSTAAQMKSNPGEAAFFKLLRSELNKAVHFFDRAQLEVGIREARVREGIDIMTKANSLMVDEKWTLMAKSLYRLYKDLLLLETYAIMTYCSFSKILKKHDKVTKHNTRIAFMMNVVNKANFTHYPKLLAMISRCERLFDEVSQSLVREGKSGLYEDERLFINMIHRLNEQALGTAEDEGAPDVKERKEPRRSLQLGVAGGGAGGPSSPASSRASDASQSHQVNALRSLVEENELNKSSKDGTAVVDSEQSSLVDNDPMYPHLEATHSQGTISTTAEVSTEMESGKRSFDSLDSSAPNAKRVKSEG